MLYSPKLCCAARHCPGVAAEEDLQWSTAQDFRLSRKLDHIWYKSRCVICAYCKDWTHAQAHVFDKRSTSTLSWSDHVILRAVASWYRTSTIVGPPSKIGPLPSIGPRPNFVFLSLQPWPISRSKVQPRPLRPSRYRPEMLHHGYCPVM